jgi:hypothetical protein
MKIPARIAQAIALLFAFLAIGIPYWQVPYANLSLPNSLPGPGLIAVFVLAALLRLVSSSRLLMAILVAGAAVPAAVMARVVYDGLADPTSHNLWPLEIIIAGVIGFAVSLAGALLGSLPGLIARRIRASRDAAD